MAIFGPPEIYLPGPIITGGTVHYNVILRSVGWLLLLCRSFAVWCVTIRTELLLASVFGIYCLLDFSFVGSWMLLCLLILLHVKRHKILTFVSSLT